MKIKSWYWLFAIFLAILIFLAVWSCRRGEGWQILLTPMALVLAGAIAYQQLEHARHTRCAELLLEIMKWWNSNEMMEARKLRWQMKDAKSEILKLYKAKNLEFVSVVRAGQFGECLGVLVLRKYVDVKDIWLLFEDSWEKVYQDFGSFLDELKQKDPSDTTFCNLKLLCEELEKIQR